MSYKVRIESFEGPFDLLLYLVSRQKVDIGAISITQIADQYLEEVSHMDNLDLDVASDFLLVASTLLEIKAQSLIPRPRDEVDEELIEVLASEHKILRYLDLPLQHINDGILKAMNRRSTKAEVLALLARLREKSAQLTQAAGENERLLLELLESSKR